MIPFTAAPSPVTMSAGVKSSSYTVALTGKTFEVLSSMLYKDPILAIIRELVCNSSDSHVENGNPDTPFDIHLPNQLEPFFSVRDYGTGMSAESIDSVYTKFFESTKTNSNDVVGALGLGSKSPFSYTSNYTITSWHGGLKLVYSAFKTADGIPSIALLGVSDTDEPSGLEVNFAVKQVDFEKFTSKVQSFFTTWGSTPPKILGGLQGRTNLRHVEREFGGTDWFVATANGPLSSALAIQGNVPYPLARATVLSSNTFRERFTNPTAVTLITRLLELPIVITFPIGSLDFSASREELQYTEQTVAVILDKLVKIGEGIGKHLQDQFSELPTMWDVVKFCRTLRSDRLRSIITYSTAGKLMWKGQEISIDSAASVPTDVAKITSALAKHDLALQSNLRRKMVPVPLRISTPTRSVAADGTVTVKITESIDSSLAFSIPGNKITFVVLDEAKGGTSKLKFHYLNGVSSSHKCEVFSISVPRGVKITDKVRFNAAVTELLEAFNIPGSFVEVVYASTLAPAPKKGTNPSTVSRPDDTFKIFNPCITGTKCPDRYALNEWTTVDEARLDAYANDSKYKHIVFVPQIRGVPQFTYVNSAKDTVFNEITDDFSELWNGLAAAVGTDRILLVGIKSSMMESKKVVKFTQQAQSLETFIRFWVHANAVKLATTGAYHLQWTSNYGNQNVALGAISTIDTVKSKTVNELKRLVNLFICGGTAQSKATTNNSTIKRLINTLHAIDRSRGAPHDPQLTDVVAQVDKASSAAATVYRELSDLNKKLLVEFPMVSYVNDALRHSSRGTTQYTEGCKQIQNYIKLVAT